MTLEQIIKEIEKKFPSAGINCVHLVLFDLVKELQTKNKELEKTHQQLFEAAEAVEKQNEELLAISQELQKEHKRIIGINKELEKQIKQIHEEELLKDNSNPTVKENLTVDEVKEKITESIDN